MICCGGTRKISTNDGKRLLNELRNVDELKVPMNLVEKIKCEFDPKTGHWRNNFSILKPLSSDSYDKEIKELNEEKLQLDLRCEEIEKEYLAKVAKLLYLTQTHLQIKEENEDLFEKFNIKKGNKKPDFNNFDNNNQLGEQYLDK